MTEEIVPLPRLGIQVPVPPYLMRQENLCNFQWAWSKRPIRVPIEFLETSWRQRWDGTDIYGTFNNIWCGINYNLSPLLIPMGLNSWKVENSNCRKIDKLKTLGKHSENGRINTKRQKKHPHNTYIKTIFNIDLKNNIKTIF